MLANLSKAVLNLYPRSQLLVQAKVVHSQCGSGGGCVSVCVRACLCMSVHMCVGRLTSSGDIFSPPRLMSSLRRPVRVRKPSASRKPWSPVWNQPPAKACGGFTGTHVKIHSTYTIRLHRNTVYPRGIGKQECIGSCLCLVVLSNLQGLELR